MGGGGQQTHNIRLAFYAYLLSLKEDVHPSPYSNLYISIILDKDEKSCCRIRKLLRYFIFWLLE
ncbi:hypothetical protein LguiB_013616 [Lonicera macranthoides]